MVDLISKKIRGFRDILPEESKKFLFLEEKIHKICSLFNANQIRLPALESLNLFKRSIGESSDIVKKEMYSFNDKNDETVCLIPEGTAPCMRLAFENNLIYDRGVKKNRFYYYTSMFRHERPQKGRYRQFTQFGVEFMGDDSIYGDIDLLLLSKMFFEQIKLDKLKLNINSLGLIEDRNKYSQDLQSYFNNYSNSFNDQQKNTIKTNPLRILDSKDQKLIEIVKDAPNISDYINKVSSDKFNNIIQILEDLNIDYIVNNKLVRGLDYYNDLVFEWKTDQLGTQDAICAGGRYDSLSNIIGNQYVPAVGFAMGIDRVVDLITYHDTDLVIGLSVISDSQSDILKISSFIRGVGDKFRLIQMDADKSLTKQIKTAVKSNCDILVIVGSEEMSNNTLTIKDLKSDKDDRSIGLDDFSKFIEEY
tara:strand:+ start:2524 stop:3783 length:1260 start_codon:yes stop_codon:yes gene_type:complete